MAHVLIDGEKTTQRKAGQWSRCYLAVPEYHVIYSARLASVPTTTDMVGQIDFVDGEGSLAGVLPDMTVYVGTAAGKYDLGMCRIRKAPLDDCADGTLYIGETSEINWQANAYLTVVDDYQLWQKPIRIVNEEAYMDYDVDYSDQHEDFYPVPAMGTHRVKRLAGASVNVTLGPSADVPAWVHGSTISSRTWSVSGATLDNASAVNPVATFTAAGTYLAYCAFTAANGKTFTGVRYVIIYDDDHPLIEAFTVPSGRGSWEQGGYSFDVELYAGTEQANLRERSLVILCSEDFAEREAVTMPGQITGAENIICVGWISDIENERDSEKDGISFTVESAEYWLKQIRDFPSGLELKIGTPTAWTDMPSMTVDRALWHFLHWRSTATRIMDIELTGSTKLATRFETARANLWERLVQVAEPTVFARPFVDNFGRLFVSIDPQMVGEDARDFPVVMTIEEDDIEGAIQWTRRDVTPLSMLFFSGIRVDASGSASSFFSMSPGHAYAHHGEEEPQDNYLVSSQADSNALCGLYFGWRNGSPFNLEITFAHSMRVLGMAPRQYFYFSLSSADDPRGIGYAGNLVPRSVGFRTDPDTKFIQVSCLFEPETFGGLSVDGDVPGMEDFDFSIPDLPSLPGLPALPTLPIIAMPPTVENLNHPTTVVLATDQGVFYTETFDEDSPTWLAMNNGLTTEQKEQIAQLIVVPSGAMYLMTDGIDSTGWQKVFRCASLGGIWYEVFDASQFPEEGSIVVGLGFSRAEVDKVCIIGGRAWSWPTDGNIGHMRVALGSGSSFSISGEVTEFWRAGFSTAQPSPDGGWYIATQQGTGILGNFASPAYVRINSSGTTLEALIVDGTGANNRQCSNGVGMGDDRFIRWDLGGYVDIVADTPTWVTDIDPRGYQAMAFSPTGTHAMASSGGTATPYRTDDSGSTWESVSLSIPIGSDVWETCGDNNRWIFGGGVVLRLTLDQGDTYIDKIGNLLTIAPLVDITGIRYIA